MRSAVDTSVLLDVFTASPPFAEPSRAALVRALEQGSLVACDVVWAEVRARFPSDQAFARAMTTLGVELDPADREAAELAGEAWRRYRKGGGRRSVLIPDFLVAAHAARQADRLVSRDRGFTRRYFPRLTLLDPSRAR